jgi:hypothetical protein
VEVAATPNYLRQASQNLGKYPLFGTRKFLAWGSTPRPGSRAAPLSLGRHHKPFGSVRIARSLHGIDLVGASPRPAPLDPRSQRQQGSRLGLKIDTRLASGACSDAPERARLHMGLAQRRPCGLGRHVPPVGTEPGCGRRGGGLRNRVLAFPRHWYPTAMPHALMRATQAPRLRSARAPLDLVQGGGWLPPPYSNLSVPPACDAQAERPRRVGVGLLSG